MGHGIKAEVISVGTTPSSVRTIGSSLWVVVAPESLAGSRHRIVAEGPAQTKLEVDAWLKFLSDSAGARTGLADSGAGRIIEPAPHTIGSAPEVSDARVANAARLRALQEKMIQTGVFTTKQLAEGRRTNDRALRAWRDRCVDNDRLIKVHHAGKALVPAFLLDDVLEPINEWEPILAALNEYQTSAWDIWIWLASPSTWLDDVSPIEAFGDDPGRVMTAVIARRKAMVEGP